MISCNIIGGLGNQLFQIFTSMAYAYRTNNNYVFLKNKRQDDNRRTYWYDMFDQLNIVDELPELRDYNECSFNYTPFNSIKDIKLNGWFQSYKYFEKEYKYLFNLCKFEDKRLLCLNRYNYPYSNSISIHFRIGDYAKKAHNSFHGICKNDYYVTGIEKIVNSTNEKFDILCFSEKEDEIDVNNRIEYIKKSFPTFNFIKVSYDISDWEQLLIMSLCKHNIIANSTFSWWSAYMNDNVNKIIIYPLPWFSEAANINTSDLFPNKWISITNSCEYLCD